MHIIELSKTGELNKQDRDLLLSLLNNHGVIVVPTDTSYGLAARVDDRKSLNTLFALKGRDMKKTVSMVVSGRAQAQKYAEVSCKPTALWKAFLPGPLTLVLWSKITALPYLLREDKTVAIRAIPTKCVNQLLRKLPVPLTITSANKSSLPDIYSLKQFQDQYKSGKLPDAFINAGKLKKQKPSTVVSAKKGEEIEVLRTGPISKKQINDVLNSH